ncbi:MAG: hypothetical protein J4224_04090 [Candidatus Diapherotrites archaeon]|uniref:30S ribosomal protein S28e n=1 Tax=Candidatus Iainarchaeum sp. TaxID=3101447 RepID=A0A8T4L7M5_9ARCH|nr:hypothetical protein [Candidatus Diapherotrites archaeon]
MEKGTPAEVVEIIQRTGVYGEIVQVLCKILEGPHSEGHWQNVCAKRRQL